MRTSAPRNRPSSEVPLLRQCPLFAGCQPAVLRRLASLGTPRLLATGEYLFHEGHRPAGLYVVAQGAVKIHRYNGFGREQVLRIARPTEAFGEESLFSQTGHAAGACALEPTRVLRLQRPGLLDVLREEPGLALNLLGSLNQQLERLVRLLDDLTVKDVKTRFANWLLQHCPDPGSPAPIRIRLPSTHRMLAAELGTASETLSRTVAQFRRQQLLSVDGDLLTLHCPRELTHRYPAASPAGTPAARTHCHPLPPSPPVTVPSLPRPA